MPEPIPDLWPQGRIRPRVRTPEAILRFQAQRVEVLTENTLRGDLHSVETQDGMIEHHLDVVLTSETARQTILSARHDEEMVYPVWLDGPFDEPVQRCDTESMFVQQVRELLGSEEVLSVIESMLARANAEGEDA